MLDRIIFKGNCEDMLLHRLKSFYNLTGAARRAFQVEEVSFAFFLNARNQSASQECRRH